MPLVSKSHLERVLTGSQALSILYTAQDLSLVTTLCAEYSYPHFTGEKTEGQK